MNWDLNFSPKIITETSTQERLQVLENIRKNVPEDMTWIIQEKIQGIGVSISYSLEDSFHFCVRPEKYKNLSYTFHLADEVAFKIKEKIKKLYRKSGAKKEILVHGKIVPSEDELDDFYAFGLLVDGEFLDVQEYVGLFKKCDLLFAHMLLIGPLEDCLEFSLDIDSQLTNWQEAPPDQKNPIHGIIIQPDKPIYDEDGEKIVLKRQRS